jgi:hypothetical protein
VTQEQINSLIPIEEVGSSIQTSALERGGFLFKREPSIWLPAPEYWLLPDEPIDTPTDKLGLVDVDGLIVLIGPQETALIISICHLLLIHMIFNGALTEKNLVKPPFVNCL